MNSALWVAGAFRAGSVRLEDESGTPVAFTLHSSGDGPVRSCDSASADLVPNGPLRPHTSYVLSVEALPPNGGGPSPNDGLPRSLRFTTGATLLPEDELEPPVASVSVVFEVPTASAACAFDGIWACVGVGDWEDTEITARRGDKILLRRMLTTSDMAFGFQEMPDCLEFRRRAPTGRRSLPLTICGEALAARSVRETDLIAGSVICQGGVIGHGDAGTGAEVDASSGDGTPGADATAAQARGASPEPAADGCSARPAAATTSGRALWALCALAALAFVRRGAIVRS